MANVTQYLIACYGTADGYQDSRAQIELMDGASVLGYVRFHDPEMPFPDDSKSGGQIIMHLPSTMFESVLNILKNEKPIDYYFHAKHAFLGTSTVEPVSEAE